MTQLHKTTCCLFVPFWANILAFHCWNSEFDYEVLHLDPFGSVLCTHICTILHFLKNSEFQSASGPRSFRGGDKAADLHWGEVKALSKAVKLPPGWFSLTSFLCKPDHSITWQHCVKNGRSITQVPDYMWNAGFLPSHIPEWGPEEAGPWKEKTQIWEQLETMHACTE